MIYTFALLIISLHSPSLSPLLSSWHLCFASLSMAMTPYSLSSVFSASAKKFTIEADLFTHHNIMLLIADLLLRQCLNLRIHYTTGSESIYVNNYVSLVPC